MLGDDEEFDWTGQPATPDDGLLDPSDERARFAQDMCEIFNSRPGRQLEAYLTEVAMTLGRYDANGAAVDRDTHIEFDGKRSLAIFLLGMRADAARIRTEQPADDEEPE